MQCDVFAFIRRKPILLFFVTGFFVICKTMRSRFVVSPLRRFVRKIATSVYPSQLHVQLTKILFSFFVNNGTSAFSLNSREIIASLSSVGGANVSPLDVP